MTQELEQSRGLKFCFEDSKRSGKAGNWKGEKQLGDAEETQLSFPVGNAHPLQSADSLTHSLARCYSLQPLVSAKAKHDARARVRSEARHGVSTGASSSRVARVELRDSLGFHHKQTDLR